MPLAWATARAEPLARGDYTAPSFAGLLPLRGRFWHTSVRHPPRERVPVLTESATSAPRLVVVVPTYNEAGNIEALAERIFSAWPEADFLVVDDASPDGTGELAEKMAAADPRVHVLHRTAKRGYAPSSKDGFRWCLARDYDFVVTMDGDLSHDPGVIPTMLGVATGGGAGDGGGFDLVIGSRYVPGGGIEADWSPRRRAVSEMGSRYARAMVGTDVHDCTSGYRCYRASTLEQVQLDQLNSEGYAFLIEMLAQLVRRNARIAETPIVYVDRQHGHSKISRAIVLEALIDATWLGVRRLFGRG
jgi:dolichol-phosphate mannosyltransferase